jgi:hypothetical protein
VTQLYVVGNDLLPYLDRQVTGDAARLKMIFFADDEAKECLQASALLHAQVPLTVVCPGAVLALRPELPVLGLPTLNSDLSLSSLQRLHFRLPGTGSFFARRRSFASLVLPV